MNQVIAGLEPKHVWHYFDFVSSIPRGSGKEEGIRKALKALGKEKGLEVREDKVGNLVFVIPATPGCEDAPIVVLQGHMDMVWEKNNDTEHDFETEGIKLLREGDWLTADGTTLGADNGIALAAALALMDDPPAKHGKLELLFTVDEETGLSGAAGLEQHMIEGRILLNMDSEEEGFVTVGCAGGGDTIMECKGYREAIPAGWEQVALTVKGFKGGHSGIDIHENRANAIKVMGLLLDRLNRECGGLRLLAFDGGSMRNAIPRECVAVAAVPAGGKSKATELCGTVLSELKVDFGRTDPGAEVLCADPASGQPTAAFTDADTAKMLVLLTAIPSGVITLDRDIKGQPETSSNLGVARVEGDVMRLVCCSRSPSSTALARVRNSLRCLGEGVGAEVTLKGGYPGWMPDLDSKLLARFIAKHKEVMGEEPEILVIHAGLECGLLGEKFPGMEMISFGPDMESVHSPDERLNIPSTQRFNNLLKELLVGLA